MSDSSELNQFFTASNQELIATVNRLDKLIGCNHWLTVGTYKETLLKKTLRRAVPQRYSIDSGFVVAADQNGKVIRSTQTDILIWDSTNYSPLYRDEDFVLIPPEACRIMIEVKGILTRSELKNALNNFDSMLDFCFIPSLREFDIKKYIFAFNIKKMKFPEGLFKTIASSYSKSEKITLEERIDCLKEWWPQEIMPWPLLAIDGVFILSSGFITQKVRGFKEGVRFLFYSFSETSKNESQVYSIFESNVLSSLGQFSDIKSRNTPFGQSGLYSLHRQIPVKPLAPSSLMIFPKVMRENLHKDIDETLLFETF